MRETCEVRDEGKGHIGSQRGEQAEGSQKRKGVRKTEEETIGEKDYRGIRQIKRERGEEGSVSPTRMI